MPKQIVGSDKHGNRLPVEVKQSSDVIYISSAIKVAINASKPVRRKIVKNLGVLLNASPEQFDFMFSSEDDNTDNSVFDFPDSARRRAVIRHNIIDAAE